MTRGPVSRGDRGGHVQPAATRSDDGGSPAAVRAALQRLAETHPLRVTGIEARRMIRTLRRQTGCSRQRFRALWQKPDTHFGSFDKLPASLRGTLSDAVSVEMLERTFTLSVRLESLVHGPVFRWGSELARVAKGVRQRGGWHWHAGRTLYGVSRLLTGGSEAVGRAWLAVRRYSPGARTSGFHALFRWAGVDPLILGAGYVDEVPHDPRTSPVFRILRPAVESCALVGVDFLSSSGELAYLEANFCPGLFSNRVQLYPAGDPLCEGLCRYAVEHDYRRIVHYPTSIWFFEEPLRAAWEAQARARGVAYEVRDDPHHRSPFRRSWTPLMELDAEGTLYVNSRSLPSPLRWVISQKGLLEPEIARYNEAVPTEERVRLARIIHTDEDLPRRPLDSPFPNLIVKHSLRDMATGHTLFRTERIPEGIESPPYVMYEYLPPDTVSRVEDGERREYAFNYRAYLLLTAEGPIVLGAKKAVGTCPIPASLPEGPVADIRPYVINTLLAAEEAVPTGAEMADVSAATMRVGRMLHSFLRRKHRLTFDSPPGPA